DLAKRVQPEVGKAGWLHGLVKIARPEGSQAKRKWWPRSATIGRSVWTHTSLLLGAERASKDGARDFNWRSGNASKLAARSARSIARRRCDAVRILGLRGLP